MLRFLGSCVLFIIVSRVVLRKLKGVEGKPTSDNDAPNERLKRVEEEPMSDNNTPQIKYDIFVSFRGQDIRHGFLSHLIEAFKGNQINAFVDDKLERGEEIWPSLEGAIKGSSISLIVFSQGYASSRWCLEELVTILKCREENGQIVIPIFYKVEPTDVGHQSSESYKKAFAEHESKYGTTKVKNWCDALEKSAKISGIASSKFPVDAELVKEIVNLVNLMMKKLVKAAADSKRLVGIDEKIAAIELLMKKESKHTLLIGIWGMGGLGKTTLADEVCNKLRSKYDGSCFLANERDQSNKNEIIHLKEIIFSKLLGYNVKIDTPNSLPKDIVRRIGCMKVLIVLDDVNDPDHVEKLLGNLGNFGSGSRIIVTTRDKQVLNAIKAHEIYPLQELSSNEALELFNLNAFDQSDLQSKYHKLSKWMVEYAQGIPLVLKVLACHLCRKEKHVWESWLDKLKKGPLTKVYDAMKLSYDDLDCQEQQIFLDLACFFLRDKEINVGHLNSLLKDGESDDSVVASLERLKDKALITFSEDNFICMHDILQEMGRDIVYQESSKDPGSCSWLRDRNGFCKALTYDEGTKVIRSIQIDWTKINEQQLSSFIFTKMRRLKFLKVYSSPFGHNIVAEERLQFLETELRFLCWYYYPLKSLPENFSVEKLVILRLPCCKMEKLWDGVKNLVNLKELDLSNSLELKVLPDLSKATNLEVLVLWGCSKLTMVHPSIFSLAKLEEVAIGNCESFAILASYLAYTQLRGIKYLNHDDCKNLGEFSLILENMKKEKVPSCKFNSLHVTQGDLEELPSCYNNLMQLLHLQVSCCNKLQTIPELPPESCCSPHTILMFPPSLKSLTVWSCISLQKLPELPPSLETLNVESCKSLQKLPELPPSLETLNVQFCNSLQKLPELPPSLKTLEVVFCESLQTLPDLPPSLEDLNVSHYKSLQTLPELPLSLEAVDATDCTSLKTVLWFPSTVVEQLKENRKWVMFWNCLNLDEHSLVAIGLNAQINVMKFANQHLSAPNHDHVENYNDYKYKHRSCQAVYMYPGSNVAEWLEYKTTKDYIIIDLSSAPPSPKLGFIFCFVLGECQDTVIYGQVEVNLIISDDDGEGKKDGVNMYIEVLVDRIESDHVCVMYDQRCSDFLNRIAKKQTRFKIHVSMKAERYRKPLVLKGFGVSPMSTSAYSIFIQQMELRDSMLQFH